MTVVEVLVALMLLSVGLLAMAGSSGILLRQLDDAQRAQRATRTARNRLASLASRPCGDRLPGTAVADAGIRERWTVTTADSLSLLADSLSWPTSRGDARIVFRTATPC